MKIKFVRVKIYCKGKKLQIETNQKNDYKFIWLDSDSINDHANYEELL